MKNNSIEKCISQKVGHISKQYDPLLRARINVCSIKFTDANFKNPRQSIKELCDEHLEYVAEKFRSMSSSSKYANMEFDSFNIIRFAPRMTFNNSVSITNCPKLMYADVSGFKVRYMLDITDKYAIIDKCPHIRVIYNNNVSDTMLYCKSDLLDRTGQALIHVIGPRIFTYCGLTTIQLKW